MTPEQRKALINKALPSCVVYTKEGEIRIDLARFLAAVEPDIRADERSMMYEAARNVAAALRKRRKK